MSDEVAYQRNVGDGRSLMMLTIRIVIVQAVPSHFLAAIVLMCRISSPHMSVLRCRRSRPPCQHQGRQEEAQYFSSQAVPHRPWLLVLGEKVGELVKLADLFNP